MPEEAKYKIPLREDWIINESNIAKSKNSSDTAAWHMIESSSMPRR